MKTVSVEEIKTIAPAILSTPNRASTVNTVNTVNSSVGATNFSMLANSSNSVSEIVVTREFRRVEPHSVVLPKVLAISPLPRMREASFAVVVGPSPAIGTTGTTDSSRKRVIPGQSSGCSKALSKSAIRKLKQRARAKRRTWDLAHDSDAVFPDASFEHVSLNSGLRGLKFKSIPAIIGSTIMQSSFNGDSNNQSRLKSIRDRAKEIGDWRTDGEALHKLRLWLIDVWPTVSLVPNVVPNKLNPYFIDHPGVKFGTFNPDLFKETVTRKGKVTAARFYTDANFNFIYDLVHDNVVRNKFLTMQKLKSMVRQMIREQRSWDDIRGVLVHKMFTWKHKDKSVPSNGELSWCVPYLPDAYFHVHSHSNSDLHNVFKDKLNALQSSIIEFAHKFFVIGQLSHSERRNAFKAQSDEFKRILRTPDIQELYTSGLTHKEVSNVVWHKEYVGLGRVCLKSDSVVLADKARKTTRDKNIAKARREKRDRENWDLDVQSGIRLERSWKMWFFQSWHNFTSCCIWAWLWVPFAFHTLYTFTLLWFTRNVWNYLGKNIFKWAAGLFFTTESDVVEACVEMYRDPKKIVLATKTPHFRVVILEVKFMFHVLYHVVKGNKASAVEWASNFLVTRGPEFIEALIGYLDERTFRALPKDPLVSVPAKIDGEIETRQIPLSLMKEYENVYINQGASAAYVLYKNMMSDSVDTQDGGPVPVSIVELLHKFTGANMTPQEIRDENFKFQYIGHIKRSIDEKTNLILTLMSFTFRTFFGCDPFNRDFQEQSRKLIAIIKYADSLDDKFDMGSNRALIDQVIAMTEQARTLSITPSMASMPGFLVTRFNKSLRLLEIKCGEAHAMRHGTYNRVEPTFVFMTGPPGVGKTSFVELAAHALFRIKTREDYLREHPGEDLASAPLPQYGPECRYIFDNTNDFWSGYSSQPIVLMDDIFASREKETRVREAQTIIRMVNRAPFSLNMPFENKGTVFFDSPYVFATTNIANRGLDKVELTLGLEDNSAFVRRCGVVLHKESKYSGNDDETFLVTHCPELPEFVGRSLGRKECIELIRRHQEMKRRQFSNSIMTDAEIDELFPVNAQSGSDFFDAVATYYDMTKLGLYSFIGKPNEKHMIILFFVMSAIAVTVGVWRLFMGTMQPESLPERIRSGYRRAPGQERSVPVRVTRATVPVKVESSSGVSMAETGHNSLNAHETLINSVGKCVCWVTGRMGVYSETCIATCIRPGQYSVPGHFFFAFDPGESTITISNGSHEITCDFPDPATCKRVEEDDLVLMTLPKQLDGTSQAYSYLVDPNVDAITLRPGHPLYLMTRANGILHYRPVTVSVMQKSVTYTHHDEKYYIDDPLTYSETTESGDSGAPLVYIYPDGKARIIGFHVGRRNNFGVSLPMCKQDFANMLGEFIVQSCIVPHRTVAKGYFCPRSNEIRRSPVFGWGGPPHKIPAMMRKTTVDGVEIDPMLVAQSKLNQNVLDFDPGYAGVVDLFLDEYPPRADTVGCLSWNDTLRGDKTKGLTPICHSTSPGYPYCLSSKKGKSPYIRYSTDGSNRLEYQDEFLAYLKDQDEKLRSGQQIEALFADVLKQETRPVEKQRAGKTRLIATSPLHLTLLTRRYFGEFVANCMTRPADGPMSPGINPHSVDWTILHGRMKSLGGSVVAGDFTNWDGSVPVSLAKRFLEIVNKWYGDEPLHQRVRELLMEHIYYTERINGVMVYRTYGGVPSGSFLTTIINSVTDWIAIVTVLRCDLSIFEYEIAVYGDDNLIHTQNADLTCADFAPHFKRRFGMKYTHFLKDGALNTVDTIDSVRYLGRGFLLFNSFYRAPLKIEVVREITYWISTRVDRDGVFLSSAESFFVELSHFNESEFRAVALKFLTAVEQSRPDLLPAVRKLFKSHNFYFHRMYVASSFNPFGITTENDF